MAETATQGKRDWDLMIPLVDGGQAMLRVPIPVTDEDFDMLKAVVVANLDAMRRTIVCRPTDARG